MPPRLQSLQRLGTASLCLRPAIRPTPSFLPVIQTANLSQREKKRKAKQDPYKHQQALQRKAANQKRQSEIQAEKDASWGDPIHGIPTPFVESFDSAGQAPTTKPVKDDNGNIISDPRPLPTSPGLLNHLVDEKELQAVIDKAYILTKPVKSEIRELADPAMEALADQKHELVHAKAVEALKRILSMDNANSKILLHTNIKRCVEEFGRHNTDKFLTKKPKSALVDPKAPKPPIRGGPDTGSSEVQVAILTAKIRKLSHELSQNRGYKDKHNKRNLRVLCHRRQKLLKYMERSERGSGRWTHLLEKLGLSPATYKEQISF
ncbi:ribosomal protein S15 [Colletotrichum paranaense]|uniref:Ribosomal protein S15 n=4 Tax=Colletotrichum acutatum species complex TaxID=2707335 RepID=A0AAJ0E4I5_9PEZI|nr:ribosomal protein S15 [Colletotrichum costaricense]XP_060354191.1 ribosomal protein S15 [Colletotrichum paranaense]XP_060380973.1 ribosomal protein S15 [Colletotrichum tamarilloi]KAI3540219.1 ribosomal protein S15 [Colletotrichum filicis]KAK0380795.1 ribosomal protein S15 [Colletotrichum limetticola]KAK1496253.1 ribosomal protein S15 [Colletotrichum tamarilloi]KAK1535130.1 ribosomal protein S15 [Colletotrichum costaricense]KAK1545074.1 ribosomal protein S15 [Colletotrichum paranaense]